MLEQIQGGVEGKRPVRGVVRLKAHVQKRDGGVMGAEPTVDCSVEAACSEEVGAVQFEGGGTLPEIPETAGDGGGADGPSDGDVGEDVEEERLRELRQPIHLFPVAVVLHPRREGGSRNGKKGEEKVARRE